MRTLWLWIGNRCGWMSTEPPPPRRVIIARPVTDPALEAAMMRSHEITRAIGALQSQLDIDDRTRSEVEAAIIERRRPHATD